MRFIILTIMLIFSTNAIASNFNFISFEDNTIGKVLKSNNIIYFYTTNGTIFKLDLNKEIEPKILYSGQVLNNQGINGIGDWEIWNENIIAVGGNKVVNITDDFKSFSVNDEFDNEKSSGAKKYRNYNSICVDSNNYLLVSSGATIVKNIGPNGIKYTDGFSEIYEIDQNFNFTRIVKEDLNSFVNFNNPVCTQDNEIYYIDDQKTAGKGGLIKLNTNRDREVFDLQSHSGKVYKKWPDFLNLFGKNLAIGYTPRKDGGYAIEGVSLFDPNTENWSHDNNFINEVFTDGNFGDKMGFHPLTGIKNLGTELTAYLGKGIIFKNNTFYKYLDINKILREQEDISSWDLVLDIYKTQNSYVIIHKYGIFVFPESVTSVKTEDKGYVETYEIINNKLLFRDNDSKHFSIYNVNGKLFSEGKVINELSLSNLERGLYFIVIDDKIAIKFLRE